MIGFLKQRKIRKLRAKSLYDVAVAQARQEGFYETLGVPDSVDGRYEMISLHCYLMLHQLKEQGEKALSQKLFDTFFKNMDVSLREQGVGDLGIPKHMKRMMKGFNGRATSYEAALVEEDDAKLKEALIKNVYGTVDAPSDAILGQMVDYIKHSKNMITGVDLNGFNPVFPNVLDAVEEGKQSA